MALNKSSININFGSGLDTKTDKLQVAPGKMLVLENTVFDKGGLLQKSNGYNKLANLSDDSNTAITTFNGNATAIGNSLNAYNTSTNQWFNKGPIEPIKLSVLPLIRSNTNQSQSDTAISSSGLVCTVYQDNLGNGTVEYKYAIADSVTGQNIIEPSLIPSSNPVIGPIKVFVTNRYFIIVFGATISASTHLQYITVSLLNPTIVSTPKDISSSYSSSSAGNFDGAVLNDAFYIAWNGADGGGAIRFSGFDKALTDFSTHVFTGHNATILSVSIDTSFSVPVVYASFVDSSNNGWLCGISSANMSQALAPIELFTSTPSSNITVASQNGLTTVLYEVINAYTYDSGIPTHYINKITLASGGSPSSPVTIKRSVGLASHAFIVAETIYVLTAYQSDFQPTYFLIDSEGNEIAKLAYSNGGGYLTTGLPSVTVNGTIAQTSYLYKDLVAAVNKTQGAANSAGIYAQTGINMVGFDISSTNVVTSEIGNNLNISGGFLWSYDGYSPVEQGFHVWPDNVEITTSTTGGSLSAQEYFYQVTYEWSDNQGNIFRSAPSVPVSVTTTGSTSANTINVPTLRLTYKLANPVKIVIYRWSTAQETYFQVTSIINPTLNDPTIDSIAYVDTLADSSILGNNIIYTNGGVIEDVPPPSVETMTLWQSRLWTLSSEDRNLLYFSKQVIEGTPVEMSDLLTYYVAPTTGAQGSTGPITALSAMDDKLIVFKKDSIYYVTGQGPDNTGANNQFSDPVFITSTVGCISQQSIVFMPEGLMFQSDKGIWLLDRDLSTEYLGAPVEQFNDATVNSASNIPATNQVRFTLDTGITLMYDYYFSQWGTFTIVPAISSTIYQGLHTFINNRGEVYQESPGKYLVGSKPVLMNFTTAWFNLAGLQGFERAYFFYILGTYLSPHKLSVSVAYDYNPSPTQSFIISPDNYAAPYGSDPLYGNNTYGGSTNIEQWRIFLTQQKCQAFQITITEVFDASFGTIPGAGLTLSGIDLVVGAKGGYPRLRAAHSTS